MNKEILQQAIKHFEQLLESQEKRILDMKEQEKEGIKDKSRIKIGVVGGDGIGPYITDASQKVLEKALEDRIKKGEVEIVKIDGLTIENRAKAMAAIPPDVLAEIKKCDVILKGPTTTPEAGSKWPNIESANVAMRRELDLFANVRPVRIPSEDINWIFFRENTEGAYVLGSKGMTLEGEMAVDFTITTKVGTERILRMGFEHARKNGLKSVTIVTKANIIKNTDGMFLNIAKEIAKDYPEIQMEGWYVDIISAKLLDQKRRKSFQVFILPNLYGDIITDEAAELQGGVGTAGSANIGNRYAMFEAIHGSAPRMVEEGREIYADPSSMIKAVAMMLSHLGHADKANKIEMALDVCCQFEKKLAITGRQGGAMTKDFTDYIIETIDRPDLEEVWKKYISK